MKVILLQDVAKIGRRFEVATVPDGYALNMLIPRGMAEIASPENMKRLKARTAKATAEQAALEADFDTAIAALKDTKLQIAAELNEQGHMFEALKSESVIAAAAAAGIALHESQIIMDTPIKEAGEYPITLQVGEKADSITIEVVAK